MSQWQSGRRLKNGRFIIQEPLGEGGFGIAYLAKDTELNRKVVIKTLNEAVQSERNFERFKGDFKKEAERLSQCRHTHIVPIYDKFDEGELPCIVMEYITGETLGERLNRGVIKENEALDYIRQIGEALEVVHANNLVHRDVKPGNIMIRKDTGQALLIDFGIAREFHIDKQTIYFSEGYTPIEQYIETQPKGAYTDVYALAATLYVILTGENPANAQYRHSHISITREDPLKPPRRLNNNISIGVNNAILEGMKIDPRERPQTIREWLNVLTNSVSTELDQDNTNQISKKELLFAAFSSGFIYGLLSSPLALLFSQPSINPFIVCGIWLLSLISLIFLQYRFNDFLKHRILKYFLLAVGTAVLIITVTRFSFLETLTISLCLTIVSTFMGGLLMFGFINLRLSRSSPQ